MIPPLMSSTLSMEDLKDKNEKTQLNKTQTTTEEVGRPKKSDSEKSEKTIQNQESIS